MKLAALLLTGEGLLAHVAVIGRTSLDFWLPGFLLLKSRFWPPYLYESNWIKPVEFHLPPPRIARKSSEKWIHEADLLRTLT